eukprot:jgi/Mesvir1/10593/Mv13030-RA.1
MWPTRDMGGQPNRQMPLVSANPVDEFWTAMTARKSGHRNQTGLPFSLQGACCALPKVNKSVQAHAAETVEQADTTAVQMAKASASSSAQGGPASQLGDAEDALDAFTRVNMYEHMFFSYNPTDACAVEVDTATTQGRQARSAPSFQPVVGDNHIEDEAEWAELLKQPPIDPVQGVLKAPIFSALMWWSCSGCAA